MAESDKVQSLLRCVLVFALLGPIISWPLAYGQFVISGNYPGLSFGDYTELFVAFADVGIVISHAFGFLPALIVGLAYWRLRRDLGAGVATLATMVIGAFAATVLGGLQASLFWEAEFEILQFFPIPGAIAALLCAAIARMRLSYASPENVSGAA